MNAMKISVVILCHNEEHNLPRSIRALGDCAEVVVVDDGSTDRSMELAKSLGARVVTHAFESFAAQRNWAMDHAGLRHDWVLHLDADEVMTPEGLAEIRGRLDSLSPHHVGFIPRKVMLGETWLKHSADYPVYVPRLLRRDGPRFYMRGHGEWIDVPEQLQVKLNEPMLHYNFSRGWEDWWRRHEKYAADEVRRILTGLPPVNLSRLFSADSTTRRVAIRSFSYRLPGRPFLRFAYSYFIKRGFLDGLAGWQFCRAMMKYEQLINARLHFARREAEE